MTNLDTLITDLRAKAEAAWAKWHPGHTNSGRSEAIQGIGQGRGSGGKRNPPPDRHHEGKGEVKRFVNKYISRRSHLARPWFRSRYSWWCPWQEARTKRLGTGLALITPRSAPNKYPRNRKYLCTLWIMRDCL